MGLARSMDSDTNTGLSSSITQPIEGWRSTWSKSFSLSPVE
jgi:hypothetical protein